MSRFTCASVLDLIESSDENIVRQLLSEFSCPANSEIEFFARKNAMEFSKRRITVTHLLLDENAQVVALLALTHKAIEIDGSLLSNSLYKKLTRYALPEPDSNTFLVSAFLIAQVGKNYSNEICNEKLGNEIMQAAFDIISDVQSKVGGRVVYLECDKSKEKLLDFYTNEHNRFIKFRERYDSQEKITYNQLFRIL